MAENDCVDVEDWLRAKMKEEFEAKFAKVSCPVCDILPIMREDGVAMCPICGYEDPLFNNKVV